MTDTEGTFRPERIAEIAERFGGETAKSHYFVQALTDAVDPDQACDNIVYARALNSEVSLCSPTIYGHPLIVFEDASRNVGRPCSEFRHE